MPTRVAATATGLNPTAASLRPAPRFAWPVILRRAAQSVGSVAAFIVVWWLLAIVTRASPLVLPTPDRAVTAMITNAGLLAENTLPTIEVAFLGLLASIIVAIPLGVALATPGRVSSLLYPLVLLAQLIPKIVLAPLFVIWFGFGSLPRYLFVFLLTFFPVVIATATGIRSVPPEMRDLARVCRMSRFSMIFRIEIPWALPTIFGGLKVAGTFSMIAAIVSEFVSSQSGLGHTILAAENNLQTPLIFGAIIIVAGIDLCIFGLIVLLEKLFIPWHASQRLGARS